MYLKIITEGEKFCVARIFCTCAPLNTSIIRAFLLYRYTSNSYNYSLLFIYTRLDNDIIIIKRIHRSRITITTARGRFIRRSSSVRWYSPGTTISFTTV